MEHTVTKEKSYLIYAINLYDSINIRSLRGKLEGKQVESSHQEIFLQHSDERYTFAFKFGCFVFVNMTDPEIQERIKNISSVLGTPVTNPSSETYEIRVNEGPARVEFEFADVKKLSHDVLRVICRTVGQSASLENYETITEDMLSQTTKFMERLSVKGGVPFKKKTLLQLIGKTAGTRQTIISNLSVLDPPDEIWKSKELERLFHDVQSNFDIDVRFRAIEKKLVLIQDNIEILSNLTATRRAAFLETIIVILILIEVIFALFYK